MLVTIHKDVKRLMQIFQGSFINAYDELILDRKYNIYFNLTDVHNTLDLKCKVLAWVTRPCIKGIPSKNQKVFRQRVNEFLVTEFTFEEFETIYTYLGNDIKRELCETFVRCIYDMNVIYDCIDSKEIKEKA